MYSYDPNRHQEEVYLHNKILLMKPMKQVHQKYILLSLTSSLQNYITKLHSQHEDRPSYTFQQPSGVMTKSWRHTKVKGLGHGKGTC